MSIVLQHGNTLLKWEANTSVQPWRPRPCDHETECGRSTERLTPQKKKSTSKPETDAVELKSQYSKGVQADMMDYNWLSQPVGPVSSLIKNTTD